MAPAGAKQARQRKGRAVKGTRGIVNVEVCASSTQPVKEETAAKVSSRRTKLRKGAAAASAADTGPGRNTRHAQDKRRHARVASSSKDGQQPTTAMVAVPRGLAAKTQHIPSSTQAMRTRRASAASQSERLATTAAAKSGSAKEAEAPERAKKRATKRSRSSMRESATKTSRAAAMASVETIQSKESDDAAKAMHEGGRVAHSSCVADAEEPSHTAAAEEPLRRKRGRPSKAQKCAEDAAAEQPQAARIGIQQLPAGQPAAEWSGAAICAATHAAIISDPPSKRRRTGPSVAQIVQTAATAEGSEKGAEQSPAKAPLSQRRQASATAASDPAADEAARADRRGASTSDKRQTKVRAGGENAGPGLDLPRKSPLPSKRGARIPLSPSQHVVPSGASGGLQPPCPADAAEAKAATAKQFAADGESKANCPYAALQTQLAGPPSPQDPAWFDPTDPVKVHAVETSLHVSQASPGSLPLCRDAQAQELMRLLQLHISSCQGGSVYVSGLPGTGKSLTVHEVARQCWAAGATTCQGLASPTFVSINCMALQQPSAIFRRVLEAFQQGRATVRGDPIIYSGGVGSTGHENALAALKDFVQQPPQSTPGKKGRQHTHGMLVLILDEMDQLVCQSRGVLYELFALPQLPRSRLILLGISNSIDMAERTLPLLRDLGSHPHAVPFPSYTAQQMGDIIRQRLCSLPGPVVQEHAVTFCARKMAAHSGDMRRALEACASALKILVADASLPAPPGNGSQGAEGTEGPAAVVAAPKRRLVGLGDMAEAVSSLQGGTGEASAAVQAMRSLPQQQQLVLCVAAKLLGQADQTEAALLEGRAPGTPTAKSKAQKQRAGALLSPSHCRTPSGKGRQPGTPAKAPGSATAAVSRSSLLGASQECSLGLLHESYMQLCKQVAMKPLSSIEFTAACSTLADMGIMEVGKAREERQRKVSLRTHKDDVALALKDVRLLRNFLSL